MGLPAATASTGQLVFGQFVDDLDARQISRQRLAFATAWCGLENFFIGIAD